MTIFHKIHIFCFNHWMNSKFSQHCQCLRRCPSIVCIIGISKISLSILHFSCKTNDFLTSLLYRGILCIGSQWLNRHNSTINQIPFNGSSDRFVYISCDFCHKFLSCAVIFAFRQCIISGIKCKKHHLFCVIAIICLIKLFRSHLLNQIITACRTGIHTKCSHCKNYIGKTLL